jgi:hypothetical protein
VSALLTHKAVAAKLGMSGQALRQAGYRGAIPLVPITPDISGRKDLLYVEEEVEAYIQSLIDKRAERLKKRKNPAAVVPVNFR